MAENGTQRLYRAPCPACGAPVVFQSAQATHAVCSYCRSVVVRSGDALTRVGEVAEVFDDHSPLQMGASGRIALDGREQAFTLIGRVQLEGEAGRWTEWTALLPDGQLAVLSEDNGAYVFSRSTRFAQPIPHAGSLPVGEDTVLDGVTWSVGASVRAHMVSAEAELPGGPSLSRPFQVVELRNAAGEVLSIDYGEDPPQAWRGRSVRLDALSMQGLKTESAHEDEGARLFSCPNCGSPVAVRLDSTKAVTCPQCHYVIDVTRGIAGELKHTRQLQRVQPTIALGSLGQFDGVPWQVVGFQRRSGSEDGEGFHWDEYLLYNAVMGFQFLVDASDGWSLVRPATGAPAYKARSNNASYEGRNYQRDSSYTAYTDYVEGEFYWPVKTGDRSRNIDFLSPSTRGTGVLSREQTGNEVTWSAGMRIPASEVRQAFGLAALRSAGDPTPWTPEMTRVLIGMVIFVLLLIVVIMVIANTSSGGSSSSGGGRVTGGSYGGYTSGGSHK